MTRVTIISLFLFTCAIGCRANAAFDPVGTWGVDLQASLADPSNAEHQELIKEVRDRRPSVALAEDGTGVGREADDETPINYKISDGVVTLTFDDGHTMDFTIQGSHLIYVLPDELSEGGKIYFSKQL